MGEVVGYYLTKHGVQGNSDGHRSHFTSRDINGT